MTDVPRHAEYEIGDTVVTSGHSTVFIEGIPVGTVASKDESDDEMSYTLKIHLFTDFGRLNDVYVMALPPREELKELERDIKY
jgi:rod shape-determining protein MreC